MDTSILELIRKNFLSKVTKMSIPSDGSLSGLIASIYNNESVVGEFAKHISDVINSVVSELNIHPTKEDANEIKNFLLKDVNNLLAKHIVGQ